MLSDLAEQVQARIARVAPDRLLAREIYDRMVRQKGEKACALITGEERIEPPRKPGVSLQAIDDRRRVEKDPRAAHQLVWNRFGDLPAFVGPGKAVIQMVGWRVDRFEDLPAQLREYVRTEAALWMAPPKDLNEIRQLQK